MKSVTPCLLYAFVVHELCKMERITAKISSKWNTKILL